MKAMLVVLFGVVVGFLSLGETVIFDPPLAATKPSVPEKNLAKIDGVMLSKTARTEEEEEEQAGMYSGMSFSSGYQLGNSYVDATGKPAEILRNVAERSPVNYQEVKLPDIQIHLKINARSRGEVMEKLAAAYGEVFKVQVSEGTREVDAYKLEADRKVLRELPRPEGTGSSRGKWEQKGGRYQTAVEGRLSFLAQVLAQELRMQVIDESQLSASYRIELEWSAGSTDSVAEDFKKSLEKQGVKLLPTKVKVTGITVSRLAAGSAPATTAPAAAK